MSVHDNGSSSKISKVVGEHSTVPMVVVNNKRKKPNTVLRKEVLKGSEKPVASIRLDGDDAQPPKKTSTGDSQRVSRKNNDNKKSTAVVRNANIPTRGYMAFRRKKRKQPKTKKNRRHHASI